MWSRAAQWAGYGDGRAKALEVGRGLAIVSVIYGHALAPWFMGAGEHFSEAAFLQWKFGASFMMVFFFFLSGVGWREEKSLATTLRQSFALVLIAWLASVAFDIGRLLASWGGFAAAIGVPALDLAGLVRGAARMAVFGDHYSLSALWFLVALAVTRVLAAVVVRFGWPAIVAVAAALLALTLLSTEFGWRNLYQLHLIGVAFAAFVAGRGLRDAVRWLERSPASAGIVLLLAGAGAVATFHLNEGCRWDMAARCTQAFLGDRFGVSMIIGQFGNLPLFALTAIVGAAFAMALCVMLARLGGGLGRRFDAWGRNSLNLLIVNALFLHMANPLVERWVMPRVEGEGLAFFLVLLSLTLAANLLVAHALTRPLRRLTSLANAIAREAVALAERAGSSAIVAARAYRVSQGHD